MHFYSLHFTDEETGPERFRIFPKVTQPVCVQCGEGAQQTRFRARLPHGCGPGLRKEVVDVSRHRTVGAQGVWGRLLVFGILNLFLLS